MRKRRYPGGGLNEAVQTLRVLMNAASTSQKELPAFTSSTAPTPPPLPEGISVLNSLESLSSLSEAQLESLQEELRSARESREKELVQWEELGKQLKSALDAALMIITLKSEPSPPKRRRTVMPSDELADQEASGDSEDSGGSEEDDSDAKPSSRSTPVPSGSSASPYGQSSGGNGATSLGVGRQVAFKLPRSAVDEWIQCEITRVITPGVRFEVRDPEPDERGNPGKTYQCRLKDIMPLPLPDQPIKPLAPGSVVFARYPETTAFYKAKVVAYSPKRRSYYLRFEGEEDAHKEIEVSDTLVLSTARARR